MPTLTADQIKKLSIETFFDNDQGEIDPAEVRAFNGALIDFIVEKSNIISLPALKIILPRGVRYTDIAKEGFIQVQHPRLSVAEMAQDPKIVLMRKKATPGIYNYEYLDPVRGIMRTRFRKKKVKWVEVGDADRSNPDDAYRLSSEIGIGTYKFENGGEYNLRFDKDNTLVTQERLIKRFVKKRGNEMWITGNRRGKIKKIQATTVGGNEEQVTSLFGFAIKTRNGYGPITPVKFVLSRHLADIKMTISM
jgi:hypothetical protein